MDATTATGSEPFVVFVAGHINADSQCQAEVVCSSWTTAAPAKCSDSRVATSADHIAHEEQHCRPIIITPTSTTNRLRYTEQWDFVCTT